MSKNPATMHVKRVTLTSKKNWWMVELDEEEQRPPPHEESLRGGAHPPQSPFQPPESATSDGYPLHHASSHRSAYPYRSTARTYTTARTPHASGPIYHPPSYPSNIFSFPTPTSYSAPPNPTQNLPPFAQGSASELFKCVVKKPNVVQLEINGEMQSNARDVTTQFLAELRVYTTVSRHRNVCGFLGALENVGMVLEYIEGRTLWDVIKASTEENSIAPLPRAKKLDFHNQLLDGLTHLHSFGLSHGDLSLLNIQVTFSSDTIKLVDFGRSVAADSVFASPDEDLDAPPVISPPVLSRAGSRFGAKSPSVASIPPSIAPSHSPRVEQIHPGTRPFSAPEVLRGECTDPLLADAYGFGIVLMCLDLQRLVDLPPWEQRKDKLPKGLDELTVFSGRCEEYLRKFNIRRRLLKADLIDVNTVGETGSIPFVGDVVMADA